MQRGGIRGWQRENPSGCGGGSGCYEQVVLGGECVGIEVEKSGKSR